VTEILGTGCSTLRLARSEGIQFVDLTSVKLALSLAHRHAVNCTRHPGASMRLCEGNPVWMRSRIWHMRECGRRVGHVTQQNRSTVLSNVLGLYCPSLV